MLMFLKLYLVVFCIGTMSMWLSDIGLAGPCGLLSPKGAVDGPGAEL